MVDFGTDIDCQTDHGMSFGLAYGLVNIGNALIRRLITPRGTLAGDSDYGTDIRAYLNDIISDRKLSEIERAAETECLKDPRVQSITATATVDATSVTRELNLRL